MIQNSPTPPDQSICFPYDERILTRRAESVRSALGAARLGVARRLQIPGAAPDAFELITVVEPEGPSCQPEARLPLSAFQQLLLEGAMFEARRGDSSPWGAWLHHEDLERLLAWPLPDDRLPCVLVVAALSSTQPVGEHRHRVVRAGLESLAGYLTPPEWATMTLEVPPVQETAVDDEHEVAIRELAQDTRAMPIRDAMAIVERTMLQRALRRAEGNKSVAARSLQVSRQMLYRRLRRYGLSEA